MLLFILCLMFSAEFVICSEKAIYPIKAKITFDPMFGRRVAFFASDKKQFVFGSDDGGEAGAIAYNGPIDIKKGKLGSDYERIIDFSRMKKVKEYDSYAAALFLPGLSYFYPRFFPSYLKKELLYQDDGSRIEQVTLHHRLIQATQLMIGLSVVYTLLTNCTLVRFAQNV